MSGSPWYLQSDDDHGQHLSLQTTLHPPADESYESFTDNLTVMSSNITSFDSSWIADLSAFEEFSHYYENHQRDAAKRLSTEVAKTNDTFLHKGISRDVKRRQRSGRNDTKEDNAGKKVNSTRYKNEKGEETMICDDKDAASTRGGCVYVRAKRGHAMDSHSLAERVRRQKISDRMKLLQSLVPNCNKIQGKIPMLDNIINYIHSLQDQVKTLMEELAFVDPTFHANYLPVETTATQQTEHDSYVTSAGSEVNRITSQYQSYAHLSPWLALLEEREYTI